MNFATNPAIDPTELAEAPTIMLGGLAWKLPKLSARQNKYVVPRLLRLNNVTWGDVEEDEIERLQSVVFTALTRAYPGLEREDFDALPISVNDCVLAIPAIIEACGMLIAGNSRPTDAAATPSAQSTSNG